MNVGSDLLVSARTVCKVFGQGTLALRVLHDIDFDVPRGQLTLLMGPSGSGKTTLVSILAGVMRPTAGDVDLCGSRITAMSEGGVAQVRRGRVGFVFQTANLFPALTALDNVAELLRMKGYPRSEARAMARTSLEKVGLGDRLKHRPGELSGGQNQRVSIARALADAPALVIGDEITSALDGPAAMTVMQLMRAHVGKDTSALLVTHDRRLERFADRIVEMEDGRIVTDTSPQERKPE